MELDVVIALRRHQQSRNWPACWCHASDLAEGGLPTDLKLGPAFGEEHHSGRLKSRYDRFAP